MSSGPDSRTCRVSTRGLVEACEPRRLFAVFIVSSLADAGDGSLREAIIDANAAPNGPDGPDVIAIGLDVAGGTVDLASELPAVIDPVFLGFRSDLGEPDAPLLRLDGSGAGAGASGLVLAGDGSYVTGIAITRFAQDGIRVLGDNNTVGGAVHVGTDLGGAIALGNRGRGVVVDGSANTISLAKIVHNRGAGIAVVGGTGNDLSFAGRAGQIRSNGGIGIDLGPPGVTPNDPNDDDAGPNDLQNYPVLTAVAFPDGKVTVTGHIDTTPDTTVLLDFFANPVALREGWQALALRDDRGTPDPADDQAQTPAVTTDGNGDASFTFTLEGAPASGAGNDFGVVDPARFITATATDDSKFNTSEFSAPRGTHAAVVGRHVFYNQSFYDGTTPSVPDGPNDDAAIATDKVAILPGVAASFANYTSYSRGVNGVMVDVGGLADTATLTAADFAFKAGNTSTPASWATLAAAPTVTVRPGAGVGGSDRVTLVWADGAVKKQWLQVTVLASATTALAAPDVFYFGNAVGESGNQAGNTLVNSTDEVGARNNPRTFLNRAPIDFRWDYNRDSLVNSTDQILARNNGTTFLTDLHLFTAPAARTTGDDAEAPAATATRTAQPRLTPSLAPTAPTVVELYRLAPEKKRLADGLV